MLNENTNNPKRRQRQLDEFIGWRTSSVIRNRLDVVATVKGVTESTLLTMLVVSGLDAMQREMLTI